VYGKDRRAVYGKDRRAVYGKDRRAVYALAVHMALRKHSPLRDCVPLAADVDSGDEDSQGSFKSTRAIDMSFAASVRQADSHSPAWLPTAPPWRPAALAGGFHCVTRVALLYQYGFPEDER
jgi:hypothetical protein